MAHWIIIDHGFGGQDYRCSNCRSSWNTIFEDPGQWDKCPNCGEKMDEDAAEKALNQIKKAMDKLQIPRLDIKPIHMNFTHNTRLEEKVSKLIQVSGKSIEELIALFAAGWTLEPPTNVYNSSSMLDLEE